MRPLRVHPRILNFGILNFANSQLCKFAAFLILCFVILYLLVSAVQVRKHGFVYVLLCGTSCVYLLPSTSSSLVLLSTLLLPCFLTMPPGTVLDLERPTIELEWWSVTNNRWNELRAEAVGANKTKAQTASMTLRKYHDANAIMLSDIGKPALTGCCKNCWDKKKKQAEEGLSCVRCPRRGPESCLCLL